MTDRPSAVATYRAQAARLRAVARDSRSAALRFELLEVAAQFERLAELAERNVVRYKVSQC
ncbi:MAG TPA: hypothetical protein VJS41_03215 [Stellaceae bacterium]|nr:hypothetical protein [Stellaceae bacterium]